MAQRVAIAFAVFVLTLLLTRFVRGWPWEFAGISGILLGGLAFVTLQTLVRLRSTLSQFEAHKPEQDPAPREPEDARDEDPA